MNAPTIRRSSCSGSRETTVYAPTGSAPFRHPGGDVGGGGGEAARNVSGHNITRCAKDQQIHTEPKAVNAVCLPPCSTSPPSTEGSDGRSHAANGYRTPNASKTAVSTLLSFTRRKYSNTATIASTAANAAVEPLPTGLAGALYQRR
jgi:hypothetical protein